ncbi:sugar phosphotransferase [Streptomyces griseoluteus]|uniref:sugar phosphotransferase n=1 Tax=Streptomyces griseoluteus TaxID=29306 RepID=UPI00382B8EA6
MSDPTSMNSAVQVYKRFVPDPLRAAAATTLPDGMRRTVKRSVAQTLRRREARLHQRALRRVRKAGLGRSERRTVAPDGRVGHVHTGLTIDLARRFDHDLVTRALDAAGICWFAVPALDDRRICLAVESRDKGAVRRVLRALLEEHTGYVTSVSPAQPDTPEEPGSHVKAWKHYAKARVIRLVWLRTEPTENLWTGDDQGIEIEFWTRNTNLPTERLVGPRPNRVQRAVPSDAPGVEIGFDRLCGYSDADAELEPTVTLETFDVVRLDEVDFPVDAVVLFEHATGWGEELLRAALRSLYQYAPWTHTVHVVAQAAPPAWLTAAEGLSVVRARPGAEALLHQLPGLAPHFLLLRPGAVVGRPVRPFDYFMPGGAARPRRGRWTAEEATAPWARAAFAATGRAVGHGYAGGPQPHRVEALTRLAEKGTPLPEAPDAQRAATAPSTHPLDGVAHHFGRLHALADPSGEASVTLHAALPTLPVHLRRLLARRDTQQIQLAGLGTDAALAGGGTAAVVDFLHNYFPVPSPFERGSEAPSAPVDSSRKAVPQR